ncbi:MAG: hypothetical protein ACOX2N_00515 [Peptococcia bacterium]|jgi:predicted ribosomally synthesized peptide with SipW-like signal peptide
MKKTRLLIATLVCAVMLMGIGYAWWNDSVVIAGTAVTGNMDVNFAEEVNVEKSDYVIAEAAVSDEEMETIDCSFTNLYPDAVAGFSGIIENNSSIPVKLAEATFTLEPEDGILADYLLASMTKDGTYVAIDEFEANFVANFNATLAGDNFAKDGELGVEESAPISVFLKIDEEAPTDTTEGQTIGFNLKLDWQQFN